MYHIQGPMNPLSRAIIFVILMVVKGELAWPASTPPCRIPDTEINRKKMTEVAERLQGTAGHDLDSVLQDVFRDDDLQMTDFHINLLHHLDDITMECTACGWWCESGELDDEQVCADCASEN